MNLPELIRNLSVIALPLLFALVFAEVMRGYAAYYLGDNTGKLYGRLSLDPSKHIDLMHTIVLPIAVYILSMGFAFIGSAKPIPINYRNFSKLKQGIILVAVSRSLSHLLQAIIWSILLLIFSRFYPTGFFISMAQAGIQINAMLFAFVLLPLPPYDGGTIIATLLPYKYAVTYESIARYSLYIILLLLISGILINYWLMPISGAVINIIKLLFAPFFL